MIIHVRHFQSIRRAVGADREELTLPDGAPVSDALALLVSRHPILESHLSSAAIAVNEERVPASHILSNGDTLALLPPFSGG